MKVTIGTHEMRRNVAGLVGKEDVSLFLKRDGDTLFVMERQSDGSEHPLGTVSRGHSLFREQKLPAVISYEIVSDPSSSLTKLGLIILA